MKCKLRLFSILILVLAFPVSAAAQIYISPVDQSTWDFGEVTVGSNGTMVVTVQNAGADPVEISVALSGDLEFTCDCTEGSVIVTSSSSAFITVTYTPSAPGVENSGTLVVGDATIYLEGSGVGVEPPPAPSIQEILVLFNDHDLCGNGPGNSAEGRKGALKNMIEAAGDLIEEGSISDACNQLVDAYGRTDGLPRPPEFVGCSGAPVLAGMLIDLMAGLGCE